MVTALVIRGRLTPNGFVADEPLPDVECAAELIVYPASEIVAKIEGGSMFSVFGKAPQLRSAEDIDQQLREERDSCDRK
jgi:hypothetical protein